MPDRSGTDGRTHLVQVEGVDHDVLAGIQLDGVRGASVLGQEVVAQVVLKGGVGLDDAQDVPALGRVAGLLAQLAAGGLQRVLAGIHHAAGDLRRDALPPEAVLPHHHDAPLRGQGHDVGPGGHPQDQASVGQAGARVLQRVEARAPDQDVGALLAREDPPWAGFPDGLLGRIGHVEECSRASRGLG